MEEATAGGKALKEAGYKFDVAHTSLLTRAQVRTILLGGLVSIVSYSRPSLMIIASRTQFHVERPWGKRRFSIVS